MTFDQYISNPMGAGASVAAIRSEQRLKYQESWDAVKLRENGTILYTMYVSSTGDYYIHFKIPSVTVSQFYYDTIIRFFIDGTNSKAKMDTNLKNYKVQFYSNDPSFTYTFAYTFNKKDLFIKDLTYKMSKLALKQAPEKRNPANVVWYVQTIYFAYLEMEHKGLFNKATWTVPAKKYNKHVWDNTVEHADDKIDGRVKNEKATLKKMKAEKAENDKKIAAQKSEHGPNKFLNKSMDTKSMVPGKINKSAGFVKKTSTSFVKKKK